VNFSHIPKIEILGYVNEPHSSNEALVVHPKGNQSSYRQMKVSTKSKKPSFKVVWGRLLKKWIVDKKDRQLCDVIEMTILLEALGIPL
jgi:hypothetical protein